MHYYEQSVGRSLKVCLSAHNVPFFAQRFDLGNNRAHEQFYALEPASSEIVLWKGWVALSVIGVLDMSCPSCESSTLKQTSECSPKCPFVNKGPISVLIWIKIFITRSYVCNLDSVHIRMWIRIQIS